MGDGGFELIYQGLQDDSPDTLRKVKAAMVGQMQLSVDRVKEILESVPVSIKIAETEEDLKIPCEILKGAGANVLIVKNSAATETSDEQGFSFEFDLESTEKKSAPPDQEDDLLLNDPEVDAEVDSLVEQLNSTEFVATAPVKRKFAIPFSERLKASQPPPPAPEPVATSAETNPSTTGDAPPTAAPQETVAETNDTQSETETAASAEEKEQETPPEQSSNPLIEATESIAGHVEVKITETTPLKIAIEASRKTNSQPKKVATENTTQPSASVPKQRVPIEMSISLGITLLLLGLVQTIFFSGPKKTGVDMGSIEAAFQRMASTFMPAPTPIVIEKSVHLNGSIEDPEVSVDINTEIKSDQFVSLKIELTTPSPPELTPEQIVHNEVKAPWVYKLEADEWRLSKIVNGEFSGRSIARTFIEYNNTRYRLTSNTYIRGHYDPSSHSLYARLEIRTGYGDQETPDVNFLVEPREKGMYRLFVKRELEANLAK